MMNESDKEYVSFLQTKTKNQAKEINELTRKLNSAKRVNRGLQRKKDIRLNIINDIREAWAAAENELHSAFVLTDTLEQECNFYAVRLEAAYQMIGAVAVEDMLE